MKPNAWIKLILLVGLAALFVACQFSSTPAHRSTSPEQSSQPLSPLESPPPVVRESLDSISAYRVVLHREVRHTQPDGSIFPEISEFNYSWTRTNNPYGYNAHRVTTLVDPQSGTPWVMDESYLVDDLAFTYCPPCPLPADQAGWSVGQRGNGGDPRSATDIVLDRVSNFGGISLSALVTQSVVIGDESINGISATHYQLKDIQALSEMVRMRTGGAPDTPLEVTMAQMDTWLTVGDHQPILYTFQAEGSTESPAGSQLFHPFTIEEKYSVTEINNNRPITVPTAVLTAVESQLKTLEIK